MNNVRWNVCIVSYLLLCFGVSHCSSNGIELVHYESTVHDLSLDDQSTNWPQWAIWRSIAEKNTYKVLDVTQNDDIPFSEIPFCFPYYSLRVASVYASPNGFLSLSPRPACKAFCEIRPVNIVKPPSYKVTDKGGGDYPLIGLYVEDLNPSEALSTPEKAEISYSTFVGAASQDVLLVQYSNVPEFNSTSSKITAQVEIWGNGTIIFRYQNTLSGDSNRKPFVGLIWTYQQRLIVEERHLAMKAIRMDRVEGLRPSQDDGEKCHHQDTCGKCTALNSQVNTTCVWCDSISKCMDDPESKGEEWNHSPEGNYCDIHDVMRDKCSWSSDDGVYYHQKLSFKPVSSFRDIRKIEGVHRSNASDKDDVLSTPFDNDQFGYEQIPPSPVTTPGGPSVVAVPSSVSQPPSDISLPVPPASPTPSAPPATPSGANTATPGQPAVPLPVPQSDTLRFPWFFQPPEPQPRSTRIKDKFYINPNGFVNLDGYYPICSNTQTASFCIDVGLYKNFVGLFVTDLFPLPLPEAEVHYLFESDPFGLPEGNSLTVQYSNMPLWFEETTKNPDGSENLPQLRNDSYNFQAQFYGDGRIALRYGTAFNLTHTQLTDPDTCLPGSVFWAWPMAVVGVVRDWTRTPPSLVHWSMLRAGLEIMFTPEPGCTSDCYERGKCVKQEDFNTTLVTTYCGCNKNTIGEFCEQCEIGYFGASCQHTCPECQNGGICHDGVGGDGSCKCLDNFSGDRCQISCNCQGGVCGTCEACNLNVGGQCVCGQCHCFYPWSGENCDIRCQGSHDCSQCLAGIENQCGWCETTQKCLSGNDKGPTIETCPSDALSWIAKKESCPQPPVIDSTGDPSGTGANGGTVEALVIIIIFILMILCGCIIVAIFCMFRKKPPHQQHISAWVLERNSSNGEREVIPIQRIPTGNNPVQGIPLQQVPLQELRSQNIQRVQQAGEAISQILTDQSQTMPISHSGTILDPSTPLQLSAIPIQPPPSTPGTAALVPTPVLDVNNPHSHLAQQVAVHNAPALPTADNSFHPGGSAESPPPNLQPLAGGQLAQQTPSNTPQQRDGGVHV